MMRDTHKTGCNAVLPYARRCTNERANTGHCAGAGGLLERREVRVVEGKQVTVFELRVHPDDLGKVIGRKGTHGAIDPHIAGRDGNERAETVRVGYFGVVRGIRARAETDSLRRISRQR